MVFVSEAGSTQKYIRLISALPFRNSLQILHTNNPAKQVCVTCHSAEYCQRTMHVTDILSFRNMEK